LAGAGCQGEREKGLKNPVLVSRIPSDSAGLRDGGFAFSDVLDLRGEPVRLERFYFSIQCAWVEHVAQLLLTKEHLSSACFGEGLEIFAGAGTFGWGKDKGRPSGL
jgi:hypothetical protein